MDNQIDKHLEAIHKSLELLLKKQENPNFIKRSDNDMENHGKLMKKMAEVIKSTGNVEKKGTNKDQGYKFATHSDIIQELRKHIAENGLFIQPKPQTYKQEEVLSRGGAKGVMITMSMEFEISDIDTGYSVVVQWFGQGMDYGDKAMYKAYTGALKYFLLDTFMISTGDDPENDNQEPRKNSPQAPVVKPEYVKPAPTEPITGEQMAKIEELLPLKGKTVENMNDFIKKTYKRNTYRNMSQTEAKTLIMRIEAMPDYIDPEAVAKGIDEMQKEKVTDKPKEKEVIH